MTDRDHDAEEGERGERIAKWLARAGVASRRDAERLIAEKRVRLGNRVVETPASFVRAGDLVMLDGRPVAAPQRTRLFRYHKPPGLVTTHRDERGRRTVFSALPPALPRVVSVGRLDLNSEGLLLLTNDGALARRLELPANGWLRRYRVRVHGAVDERALAELARGVTVEGVRYGEIEAGLDSRRGSNAWLTVALREGRNREVRRVMAHLRPGRDTADPHRLWAVPARRAAARGGGGGEPEGAARATRPRAGAEAREVPRRGSRRGRPTPMPPLSARDPKARF